MNIELFRHVCTRKKGVTEEFPFNKNILVYKVMGKMFSLTDVEIFASINLKCDPELAVELRERFEAVTCGFHMNKKHWITVMLDGSIHDDLLIEWIDNSYRLVVDKLSKSKKVALLSLHADNQTID